jgi:lipoprotein-releasing system permease protein
MRPMLNRAPLFLALRYLRPKRSFVSVITLISILGVTVGVLMMVVVRSVMSGFEVEFRQVLMGSEPHVLISKSDAKKDARPWREVLEAAASQPGATAAAPVAGTVLYVANGEEQTGLQVLGLDRSRSEVYLRKLHRQLLDGSLDLADGTLVLPDYRAQDIGVVVGDEVSVYPSHNVNEMVRKFRAADEETDAEKKKAAYRQIKLHPRKLTVAGILRSETAGLLGYMSLKTGQELLGLGDDLTGIAVELHEPDKAAVFGAALQPQAPGWQIQLWTDANQARLAAMRNEQIMMTFVLWVIAVVAAFSVMNTTITVTTQKRREIGVITALGAGRGQIVRIFVNQALVVAAIGTVLGLAASYLVLTFRNDIRQALTTVTQGQVHAVEGVFLSTIPSHVNPGLVVTISVASVVLCMLAGLIPAWFAARVDPAVALRD